MRRLALAGGVATLAIAVPSLFFALEHEAPVPAGAVTTPGKNPLAAPKPVVTPPPPTGQPNVLVVMTDDMRYDDLKYMPRMQEFFAERGTEFRNMFAPTPLCCPNRASYLTGKYSHNHGVWWHDPPWGYGSFDDSVTLATALKGAGYRTGYIGKYLNRYGVAAPRVAPWADPATYVPNGWDEWRGTPDATGLPESDPRAGGTYRYFDTTVNDNGVLEGHEGEYNSKVIADESIKLVDEFTTTKKPWYLQINSLAPHHGSPVEADDPYLNTPARPDWVKGHFDAEIPRGPGVPKHGDPEPDLSDKAPVNSGKHPFGPRIRAAVREEARQRAEALYVLDGELARVWKRLDKAGELDNTIIAFTSDNGYMEGEHRWQAGKVIGYDSSYRVPLLMAGPGIPRGTTQDSPVSTVDLTASVLDWTGAHLAGVDGRSIVDQIGKPLGWNRAIGYESWLPEITPAGVPEFTGEARAIGVRTGRYFYVRYADAGAELFDLAKDPLELESVATDPAYAQVRSELDGVWRKFHYCAELTCRIPLPRDLRTDAAETTKLREQLTTAYAKYYGG